MEARDFVAKASAVMALSIGSVGGVIPRGGMDIEAGASAVSAIPSAFIKQDVGLMLDGPGEPDPYQPQDQQISLFGVARGD